MATPVPTATQTATPSSTVSASPTPTPSNTPTSALADPNVHMVTDEGVVIDIASNSMENWEVSAHPQTSVITAVAVDLAGNIFTVGSDNTVRKLDSSGTELWSYIDTNDVTSVAVDGDGNVIIGSFGGTVKKLGGTGNLLWEYRVNAYVHAVAVDVGGYVYFGANDNSVRKLTPNGSLMWTNADHTDHVLAIAVDHRNNVYSASKDNSVHKLSVDGDLIWSYNEHITNVNKIAVDNNGIVYTAANDGTVRKIKRGNLVWSVKVSEKRLTGVSIDVNYNVYACSNNGIIKKLSSFGNEIWTLQYPRTTFTDIATSPVIGAFADHWGREPAITPTPTPTTTVTATITPTVTPSSTIAGPPAPVDDNYLLELDEGETTNTYMKSVALWPDVPGDWRAYAVGYSIGSGPTYTGHLIRINGSGTVVFQKTLSDVEWRDVTIMDDYIYAVGKTYGTDLGGDTETPHAIIAKYDLSGVLQWQKLGTTIPSYETTYWGSIKNDGTHLYVIGNFHIDTSPDTVVSKMNPDGSIVWINQIESTGIDRALALSPTNIYVLQGSTIHKLDFDGNMVNTLTGIFTGAGKALSFHDITFDGTNLIISGEMHFTFAPAHTLAFIHKYDESLTSISVSTKYRTSGNGNYSRPESVIPFGSGYLMVGHVKDESINPSRTEGSLTKHGSDGAFVGGIDRISMDFTGTNEGETILYKIVSDETNLVMVGHYNGAAGTEDGLIIINNDATVGMTPPAHATAPLDTFDFVQEGWFTQGDNYTESTPVFVVTDVSSILVFGDGTSVAGTGSLPSVLATYPDLTTPTPTPTVTPTVTPSTP